MAEIIAVGLDGSTGAERAFGWAVEAAAHRGGSIQPVMAWSYPALALLPFPAGLPVPNVEAMHADAEAKAEAVADALHRGVDVEVRPAVVRQGSPSMVLCEAAEDADVLVIGSRGLGSVTGALLGSVGSYAVAHAPCPVVLVPDTDEPADSGLVVVGVDGSAASCDAVVWADTWAPPGSTLLLVHAWMLPATLDAVTTALDADAIEGAANAMLDAAAAKVSAHDVETLTVRGDARHELARLANAADLLVLGANSRGVLHRFLLGSVSHHMAHHLVAPTAIVRAAGGDDGVVR